jgi:hypothetical protein
VAGEPPLGHGVARATPGVARRPLLALPLPYSHTLGWPASHPLAMGWLAGLLVGRHAQLLLLRLCCLKPLDHRPRESNQQPILHHAGDIQGESGGLPDDQEHGQVQPERAERIAPEDHEIRTETRGFAIAFD